MADDPTDTPAPDLVDGHDAAYWRAEATKAFDERDKARKKLREEGTMTATDREELEALRKLKAEAEEKRKLEAGEFESAKEAILKQKAEAEAKAQAAEQRYAQKVVETAFHQASELFGPKGETTLTPDFAYAGMGRYVRYVPGENGQPDGLQVLGIDGEVIRSEGGRPASFPDGMRALLDQWPGKEHILRAAQHAGSGSTGGSGDATLPVDRAELAKRINEGDTDALAQWRATQPRSRTTEGAHWEKQRAAKDVKAG